MRSIGTRARSAIASGDLDLEHGPSRSASRSFGSVIIFMYLQRRALVGGDEVDVGRRLAQRVQHPGLGGDDRRPSPAAALAARSRASRRSRACARPRRRRRRRRRTP